MGREMIKCLHKLGAKVQFNPFRVPDMRSTVEKTPDLVEMINNKVNPLAPSIWAVMPQKFYPREGHRILYTMIETKEIHKNFAMKLDYVNEVWVPSRFCQEAFESAGIRAPIKYIPLGVDTELYKPFEPTAEQRDRFAIKTKGFTFFSLFGWSLRKGYDILLRSYLTSFTSDDDVTLLIASRKNGNPAESKSIPREIAKYIKAYCPNPQKAPHILHIGEAMPEEDLPILFNMCDAYVLPSRGEGFGLPYAEAGSCELPVISSRCCGMLDFLNDNNSFLVDIEGYGENPTMRELSSYYQGMPFAILGENQVKQLSSIMRDVFQNPGAAKEKGKILRQDLVANFTWDHLGAQVYDRLVELHG